MTRNRELIEMMLGTDLLVLKKKPLAETIVKLSVNGGAHAHVQGELGLLDGIYSVREIHSIAEFVLDKVVAADRAPGGVLTVWVE